MYYGYRRELEDVKRVVFEVLMKEIEILNEKVLRLEEELEEVKRRLARLENELGVGRGG